MIWKAGRHMEKGVNFSSVETNKALTIFRNRLTELMPHGFFKITLEGRLGKGKKLELFITGGKIDKINIPSSEAK